MIGKENNQIEFGDFQTPLQFASSVCRYLKNDVGLDPKYIVEPTCGVGNFLYAANKEFNPEFSYGVEINRQYVEHTSQRLGTRACICHSDFFEFDFFELKSRIDNNPLLIIGNPPWVNSSVLSSLESTNAPTKSNIKQLKGMDALTGSSNFDICESIFLNLINVFKYTNTCIAFLCKTSVARNVFIELRKQSVCYSSCKMLTIDAKKIFNVNVDACLFVINLNRSLKPINRCQVSHYSNPYVNVSAFGYIDEKFYSTMNNAVIDIDGHSCFEWRQGVKHDCSKIMELTKSDHSYINGLNEEIIIEDDLVFPLIKSSHIKQSVITKFKKYVLVTQRKIKEETAYIKQEAVQTWTYLNQNIEYFRKRKSKIYNNSPEFSMFGVGDYSYQKYKIVISGFYKVPAFALCYGVKPVMLDDTCYFLGFDDYNDAYTTLILLNSDIVRDFLLSVSFKDSKRPYTKKILQRLDFNKITRKISIADLEEAEKKLNLESYITDEIYEKFKIRIHRYQQKELSLFG